MTQTRTTLLERLRHNPSAKDLPQLVDRMEQEQPADLPRDTDLLSGVWELRWSSSTQPWLEQPWLDNLQALDPENGRLQPAATEGTLSTLAGISVQADLKQLDGGRVEVRFRRGGCGSAASRWRAPATVAGRAATSPPGSTSPCWTSSCASPRQCRNHVRPLKTARHPTL